MGLFSPLELEGLPASYDEIWLQPTTGQLSLEDGSQFQQALTEKGQQQQVATQPSPTNRSQRTKVGLLPRRYAAVALMGAYRAFVSVLFIVGFAISDCNVDSAPTTETDELMVCVETTHKEFVRKNPTWGKAKTGPDKKQ